MGSRDFAPPEVQMMPGYSGFLKREADKEVFPSQPSQALTLLRNFRANLR